MRVVHSVEVLSRVNVHPIQVMSGREVHPVWGGWYPVKVNLPRGGGGREYSDQVTLPPLPTPARLGGCFVLIFLGKMKFKLMSLTAETGSLVSSPELMSTNTANSL